MLDDTNGFPFIRCVGIRPVWSKENASNCTAQQQDRTISVELLLHSTAYSEIQSTSVLIPICFNEQSVSFQIYLTRNQTPSRLIGTVILPTKLCNTKKGTELRSPVRNKAVNLMTTASHYMKFF
jgi:hypothetical protein